jgi:hypothetical protein
MQHAKEEMLDAAIYLQKLQDVQAQLSTKEDKLKSS